MSALTDHFEKSSDVVIVTTTRDGRAVETPIWGVVVDGEAYVRNGFGEASRWYRRLRRTDRASFAAEAGSIPVRVELVDDDATKDAVDAAYRAKYSGPGLTAVVSEATRRYTIHVIAE